MDVLDKYKKAWDNQPNDSEKVSKVDIYKMMKSKSSSIVKWIFIISILEFILPHLTFLFVDYEEYNRVYSDLGLEQFAFYGFALTYVVYAIFIYKFYLNYKNISTTLDTKSLMNKILKTRKTVKTFFIVNLSLFFVYSAIVSFITLYDQLKPSSTSKILVFIITLIIVLSISVVIFWLFYQLLYGFLLRKLYRNYKDLAKLDE